jgi:hypothetical protein
MAVTTFTVERVRLDDENGVCLISGADDEEEPAGYFIVQIEAGDPDGPFIEIFGEELSQSDGVASLEIGSSHLAFTFDPASVIGAALPAVRIESRAAIGEAVRARLVAAFGDRASHAAAVH